MNTGLNSTDLHSLEQYDRLRPAFRAKVMAHKQNRRLALGPHANLYFEDRLTVQYQVQEMLRIERIFEAEAIAEELAAYNPLIPDGRNWKATFMLEYDDPQERREMLSKLLGVEQRVWLRVGDGAAVRPICDEDLERATEDKTSSVHFMRFELAAADIAALGQGADLAAGIDHPHYEVVVAPVATALRASLIADLEQ